MSDKNPRAKRTRKFKNGLPELKWAPYSLTSITEESCIFMSVVMIWLQDPQDGKPAHGTDVRAGDLFGVAHPEKENTMLFVSQFNYRDKHRCLKVTGEFSIGGLIERIEGLETSDFRLIKSGTNMLDLETTDIVWKDCGGTTEGGCDHPCDLKHFTGLGTWAYVPWSIAKPTEVHYYVYEEKLRYVYFEASKEDFNAYLRFRDYNVHILSKGNTKRM